MCCMVSLGLPHNQQFGLICSLVKRFAFRDLVKKNSSWIADMYPSTCEEKDHFFNHKCVALSFTWLVSLRVRNRKPCCGFFIQVLIWLSLIFCFILNESFLGGSFVLVSMSKHLIN